MTTLRNIILGAASLAALAAATSASAQSTASATGTASVTIIAPITLSNTAGLAFGKVVPSGTAGSVTIAAASDNSTPASSNVTLLSSAKNAAVFRVGGSAGQTYAITLPGTISDIGGITGLNLGSFSSAAVSPGTLGTISATAANNDFYVGATLSVPATVAAGAYSTTFNVSVNYN
jgi:hypothetical protein